MTQDAQDRSWAREGTQAMRASVEAPDGAREALAATVAALQDPATYPEDTEPIEAIETHMSFVFLTSRHAYKLKKPLRTALLDHTSLERRRLACHSELALNRRLAPDVYLAVVPVVELDGRLAVDEPGPVIDWLVKMRRLPRDQMQDARIEAASVRDHDVDRIAAVLTRFYAGARRCPTDGASYRAGILADLASKRTSLARTRYGMSRELLEAAVRGQERWLDRHAELLEARAAALLDAHGDLRPEHICLQGTTPVVIDCLEFSPALRVLDPVSEISFLALECRRLGAAWIGDRLLARYAETTRDAAPPPLIPFYQSYHAVVRAAVALWHLDDRALDHTERWRARGRWYLRAARELL